MWPLTSKEGCDSPRQIKLGLNVNLENSQIIAKCHQLVAQGMRSAHDIAILLVFRLSSAMVALPTGGEISTRAWTLCFLCMPAFPLPHTLSSLGRAPGTLCRQTKDGENAGGFSFQSHSEPIPHPMLKWGRPVSHTNVDDVFEAYLSGL